MCKPKTKKNNEESPQKSDWVRVLSFCIIIVCITLLLGLLCLMAWRATSNNPDVYRVIVTTDINPDSLKAFNYIDQEQAEALISSVRAYDNQLTQKYQYLVEQKEQDSQVFYWGSLIVGIVVAVLGWFGFQSFTTIEDKAKKKAENVATNVAKRTAWKETRSFLNDEGKKQINTSAQEILKGEAIKKIKEMVLNDLNPTIENRMRQYMPENKYDELEKKIEALESSMKPDIEKAAEEAVNKLFEKYRKNTKGSAKGKEE